MKYCVIRSGPNVSMPAGTGVCVVKIEVAITAWRTSSKASVGWRSSSTRIRSRAEKALCPSFMWNTVAGTFIAASARVPPMPSTISWRIRISVPPPYSLAVMSRAATGFSGRFVSSRNRATRPTFTRHTPHATDPSGRSTRTRSGPPSGPLTASMARL